MFSFIFGEDKDKLMKKQKKLMKEVSSCIKKMCNNKMKIRELNDMIREADSKSERDRLKRKRDKLREDDNNNSCLFKECKDKYVKKIKNDIKLYEKYLKENFNSIQIEKLDKLKKLMNKGLTKSSFKKAIKLHDSLYNDCKKKKMNKRKKSTFKSSFTFS